MQGRSNVMKESFRSTKPISEFAINVLYSLKPPQGDPDHNELVRLALVEKTVRGGKDWWNVRFNQIDGPRPVVRECANSNARFREVATYLYDLIDVEGVSPEDICLLYVGKAAKHAIEGVIAERLRPLKVDVDVRSGESMNRTGRVLLATTPHSFKGYDAEVIVIPSADAFIAKGKGILANELYVAMTRARSILTLFTGSGTGAINQTLKKCANQIADTPVVDKEISHRDDFHGLLGALGGKTIGPWLHQLMSKHHLFQEPLINPEGVVVAEPVFWLKTNSGRVHACFGPKHPPKATLDRLKSLGIAVLPTGNSLP